MIVIFRFYLSLIIPQVAWQSGAISRYPLQSLRGFPLLSGLGIPALQRLML